MSNQHEEETLEVARAAHLLLERLEGKPIGAHAVLAATRLLKALAPIDSRHTFVPKPPEASGLDPVEAVVWLEPYPNGEYRLCPVDSDQTSFDAAGYRRLGTMRLHVERRT